MLDAPGVISSQVATELGIGVTVLGRWRRRRELWQELAQEFPDQGHPREDEAVHPRRELARVTKEWDFLREVAAFFVRVAR